MISSFGVEVKDKETAGIVFQRAWNFLGNSDGWKRLLNAWTVRVDRKKLAISRRYFLKSIHRRNFMKFMKKKKGEESFIHEFYKKSLWKYTVATLHGYFVEFMNKRLGSLLFYKLFSIFFLLTDTNFILSLPTFRALNISFSFFLFLVWNSFLLSISFQYCKITPSPPLSYFLNFLL